jgi:solute carrier family 45 protein 1/2/4
VFSQIIYAFGMLSLALTKSILIAPLTAITAGITYSSLFTIPFILVAGYHSKETNTELLFSENGQTAQRGLGTDLSIVSSMVFVAQIILSSLIGVMMKLVGSKVVVVYAASFFSTCAALASKKLLFL